jgi:hypothetical protein
MWNRRDFVVLATAAVASFGLTLIAFWPRTVQAVGDTPPVTNDVKQPALDLGSVSVTAALDPAHSRTVLLTLHNLDGSEATVRFAASAAVVPPTSPFSRGEPMPREVWKEEYSLNLKPGETRTLSVALPDKAFVAAPKPTPEDNDPKKAILRETPGFSYLQLATIDAFKPKSIMALMLPATGRPDTLAKATP